MVYKLLKSLYGLKQAPRNWYIMVTRFIVTRMLFKACVSDPCLFFLRSRTGRLILLYLFVDDFQGGYHLDDAAEFDELKAMLAAEFKTKDLGESEWILGMKITRDTVTGALRLDQEQYVLKALARFGLSSCKVAHSPEQVGADGENAADGGDAPTDRERYMEIVGTLQYAAISSRPDIAHAVNALSRQMQAPLRRHMVAAERVLRYLAGTPALGLTFYCGKGLTDADPVDVTGYADADWANDKTDRKSMTGLVVRIGPSVVGWKCQKQKTVAQSTCEAELYALAALVNELLWTRGILTEMGVKLRGASVAHGDNQSTLVISVHGVKTERTKHVDIKYHFITQSIADKTIEVKWVSTHDQQADIFTKALDRQKFVKLREQLMPSMVERK